MFNNVRELPKIHEQEAETIDLVYLQIPLRSIIGDEYIRPDDEQNFDKIDWLNKSKSKIDQMLDSGLRYNEKYGIFTIVSNFIVPQGNSGISISQSGQSTDIRNLVISLNQHLEARINEFNSVVLADIEMIASSLGKSNFLDDYISFDTHGSMVYSDWVGHENAPSWTGNEQGRIEVVADWNSLYEDKHEEFMEAVHAQIEMLHRLNTSLDVVKLVIFDLDNTVWRGQISEHYFNPEVAQPYTDGWPLGVWDAIQKLRKRGVLVAICSKNDYAYVKENFDEIIEPQFLKFKDFVTSRVNYLTKVDNVKSIIDELSLTPDSVLFVDDNPIERESVRLQIQGIRCIGANPFTIKRILLWAPETNRLRLSSESKTRENSMSAVKKRTQDRSQSTREEFLLSLSTKVELRKIVEIDEWFHRAVELINKSNQFNTNGQRWTPQELRQFIQKRDENALYGFKVKDKYADYGITGFVIVEGNRIRQFVLSCRVLGMEVEVAVLREIIRTLLTKYKEIVGSIEVTERNEPARDLFLRLEFQPTYEGNFEVSHLPTSQVFANLEVE